MPLPKNPQDLFDNLIPEGFKRNPAAANLVNAVYAFRFGGPEGGEWLINCVSNPPICQRGIPNPSNAQCTIEATAEDWMAALSDPGVGMDLYFKGRLRVSGDPTLATRLAQIFELAKPVG